MKAYKDYTKLKRVLKICNIRNSLKKFYEYDSILNKDMGIFFGLYLADKITFSSYRRLETLINKVREKQIISLR